MSVKLADQIVLKKTTDLIPYEKNNKAHPDEQVEKIVKQITLFGWDQPIVINSKNEIGKGHGRWLAAQKMGLTEVPCIVRDDLSADQFRAARIGDNRVAQSSWDHQNLRDELASLDALNIDLPAWTGFDPSELERILVPESSLPLDEGPGGLPKEAKTKLGDIYQMGAHRLLCGDCTMVDDVEKLMDGKMADMVWTDPPYNIDYEGGSKKRDKIENDKMDQASFFEFLKTIYSNLLIVTKPGGAIYVAHADSESHNFRRALIESGWLLKQCLIWVKQQITFGRQDYQWKHEPILYGWREGASHNWFADRKQTTVLEFDRPQKSDEHPTMKPVELVEYMLRNSSQPGDLVIDFFGGSGTTLIASERLGRYCYTMELDPKYCDVIVARWEKTTGEKAVLQSQTSLES